MTGKFEAISFWPRNKLDLGNEENTTVSEHLVSIDARLRLDWLNDHGYGGKGIIFPVRGIIRPVKEESKLDRHLKVINSTLIEYQKALNEVVKKDKELKEGKGTAIETQQEPIDYSQHPYSLLMYKLALRTMRTSPQCLTIEEVDGYNVLKVMKWFVKDPG